MNKEKKLAACLINNLIRRIEEFDCKIEEIAETQVLGNDFFVEPGRNGVRASLLLSNDEIIGSSVDWLLNRDVKTENVVKYAQNYAKNVARDINLYVGIDCDKIL